MASSKHHELLPKNQSDRENQSKDQHLIMKKLLIMSTRKLQEYAYQARPDELRLGTRVEIAAEESEEGEWDSPSLYEKMAGDLDTYRQKGVSNHSKQQARLDKR
jgi:hypothetical protein